MKTASQPKCGKRVPKKILRCLYLVQLYAAFVSTVTFFQIFRFLMEDFDELLVIPNDGGVKSSVRYVNDVNATPSPDEIYLTPSHVTPWASRSDNGNGTNWSIRQLDNLLDELKLVRAQYKIRHSGNLELEMYFWKVKYN